MSSTITETESRAVTTQSEIPENILKKRENFTRSTSIEKLKKFNNFICSQHYYILPSLLMWLKTSQSVLTSNMEKCILYVKSMFLTLTLHKCIQEKLNIDETKDNSYAAFFKLTTKDIIPILNILLIKTNELIFMVYEEIKRIFLIIAIYFGVCVIVFQFIGVISLIFFKIPPIGFVFLVGCVIFMSKIATIVFTTAEDRQMNNDNKTNENQQHIRRQLTFIGKRISNIKLF